jgi:hypothetical protein
MNHIIRDLKRLEEDFEFYPTTDEIIHSIQTDINQQFAGFNNSVESYSLLDCGAGDGRVLTKLKNGDLYAIEKSNKLIHSLPKDIYIVGTEFHQTTLIDKQVSICISNPPYSEYEAWSSKIISEANAKHVYLVIPQRWEKSVAIQHALNLREAEAKVIGSYDFLEADRKARAIVHVGRDEVTRTNRGAEGISSRVKFLLLAWAGMPKTSFRKNAVAASSSRRSDSMKSSVSP